MPCAHDASENMTETMKTLASITLLSALALAPSHARADDGSGMRLEARRLLSAMEGDARRVSLLLRSARASHSEGQAKCINGFLSQIDAGVRHGRDDVADLRASLEQNDINAARRALGWLSSRREAARWASFAADTCNGQVASSHDETEVHIVKPKLPSDHDVFAR
jgi:hypothetical protein